MAPANPLPPLPPQPRGVPWPTREWPEAPPRPDVDAARLRGALDRVLAERESPATGETHAVVAIHRGVLVAERYAPEVDAGTTLISWSMAKSITHALLGLLVGEGKLDPDAPAPVPAWQGEGDPRRAITTEQLLRMVDGLDFVEDYVDSQRSHVIEMLFGEGKGDVAAYAEARPLAHPPGRVFNYSSGTSNVVAAIVGRLVGGGRESTLAFMRRGLFEPLGMRSAKPRFDAAGNFIGSSYVFATARDFARFGLLYLRDGIWEDERVLPEGWVDHARTATPASAGEYGAHWWLALDGSGIFHASGYNGQYIVVDPRRDLVVVRLGRSTPEQRVEVVRFLAEVVRCFPERGPAEAES
jgi:CubicO group peptidase (beta-lactamase class C family)